MAYQRHLKGRMATLMLFLVLLLSAFSPAPKEKADFSPLRELLQQAVADSTFPGASVAIIHKGSVVFHEAFGTTGCSPASQPADTTTIYDAASLTKPIVTTSIIMQLIERDSLKLNLPAAHYLPEFTRNGKETVTIGQLLMHTSGLRPHSEFIDSCKTASEIIEAICADTLQTRPGTTTAYSDNGFIILGRIIEQVTGQPLAANFRQRFAIPLGMQATTFNPPDSLKARIAPTGEDPEWTLQLPRPLVNDRNTAIMGGVAGHAGLFTTTGDLARFMEMLLAKGKLEGRRYLKASTIRQFTRRKGDAQRALGWDLRDMDPEKTSAGPLFSENSWGHLGFTGTSIWVDPKKKLAVIILSNRVCPSPENRKIRQFRPLAHAAAARCLGYRKE